MSFLEKLLDGVAVEWKTLGDISIKISSGGTPNTGILTYYEGNIPWLRTQEVGSGDIWDTGIKITESGLKNSSAKMIPENCVIVAMYGATVGKIGINKIPLCTNQACANIQINNEIANYRYVYHFLLDQYEYIKSLGAGSQTNINAQIVRKLQIPIPCPENPKKSLEIQQKIVAILDSFTELTAELTAELTGRKQQYNYYREQLFSFDDGEVEWKTLGEVINLQRGRRLVRSQLEETGKYAVYQNAMTPLGYYHESNATAKTTFVICAGAAGEIGFSDVDFWAADDVTFCITPDYINNRFVYYYLQTQQHKILSQVRRASIPRLSKNVLEKLIIPIPSKEEQNRIVSILDKFDILTNSISEGLPKEIALRKQQYEYYRDLLLTFKQQNV